MTPNYLVNFPGLGIHDLPVNRVAVHLFGLDIYWYGILIALAVVLVLFLGFRDSRRFGLNPDRVVDAMILIVPCMIIFARLYYVAFQWANYRGNLWSIFDTRDGGLAFYGGVIGGLLALFLFAKWRKYPFGRVLDFFVVYVPLGQAIGRWGNFFNQEAFGNNTTLPWGMISNGTTTYLTRNPQPGVNAMKPVHPTFLYEFVANLIIFAILYRIRKQSRLKYETTAWYLVLYGAVRFFVESVRTDALYIPGTDLRVSMVLSAVMVVFGLLFLAVMRRRDRAGVLTAEGISVGVDGDVDSDANTAAADDAAEASDVSASGADLEAADADIADDVADVTEASAPGVDDDRHADVETDATALDVDVTDDAADAGAKGRSV